MAYGLVIKNDADTVQIDENYSNYHLISKVSATTDTNVGTSGASSRQIVLTNCRNTIIALRSDFGATCFLISKSGTTWTFLVMLGPVSGGTTLGGAFTYYRFEPNPPPVSGNWGLQVFDASGNVTFDSRHKTLRVAGFHKDITPGGAELPQQFTYTSGRTYAFIVARTGSDYRVYGGGGSGFEGYIVLGGRSITNGISAAAFTHTFRSISPSTPPYGGGFVTNMNLIGVDVTHY